MKLRFGEVDIDPSAREVRRAGRAVDLSPKAMTLLIALVEARPRALSRAELHDRVWPETFVSESSLRQLVVEVRRAVGDDHRRPQLIRTVRRWGYAFAGAAAERAVAEFPPRASLLRGPLEIPLAAGDNVLGRAPGVSVRLSSWKASRRHARIRVDLHGAVLEDLGSKNGTLLNGTPVKAAVALEPGDRIEIGREVLVYCHPAGGTTRTDSGQSGRGAGEV
jgi:DNA-binding winged helix-turn-helix (wHTH) protein